MTLLILGGDQTGRIDPQQLAAMRHQLGLDQPIWVQFGTWLWGVLRLDFGTSLWTGQPRVALMLAVLAGWTSRQRSRTMCGTWADHHQ
jgi:ABC-type dipeptide/oligopeptide/nickel transport system permease component